MEFKFIEEILGFFPDLRVLERNSQPYSLLLYQHQGTLVAGSQRIGNPNGDAAAQKQLNSFFLVAKQNNVDLGLTPEYSCPWTVIENIIANQQSWPSEKKLWVVGAESITKEDIIRFKEKYNNINLLIFFDESLLQSENNFFDPLLYFFVSTRPGGLRLNLIIQFKTHHMSVWSGGEIERDNIILGKDIYVFRNAPDSIHLCSLICSEAMNFQDMMTLAVQQQLDWLDKPYLILNPQLNGEPTHNSFTAFRKFVMRRQHKEIISLNWNMQSKLNGENLIPIGTSRSGFIIASSEINQNDYRKIKQNHSKGLYYFYFGILNKHAFLCNSYIHAFLIHTTAVDISNVVPQQARRDGPQVIEVYGLDKNHNLVGSATPSDSSINYMNSLACDNAFLCNADNCIVEKERLACLTAGEIFKGSSEWYNLANLYSIRIDENTEINRRITFAEDTVVESTDQRKKYIRAIIQLGDILLNKKDLFPESILALKAKNLIIAYHQVEDDHHRKLITIEKYKYNITTNDGERVIATLCFLDHPTEHELNEKFDILRDLFDDNANMGRVVIFYNKGVDIRVKYDSLAGQFTSAHEYKGPSILKEQK